MQILTITENNMEIGYVGLGGMGHAMASNLISKGHTLRVWNRSPGKAADLVAQGATLVEHPGQAAAGDGVVFTMVADDAALEQVVGGPDGIAAKLGPGGIHVSMSTVSPETTQRIAALHAERGAAFVAAPVFGRPTAAAAAMLFILVAGEAGARDKIMPLLETMGQRVFPLGDDPVAASIVKLSGNFMIMGVIEAMAEAATLCEKYGVERSAMMDVMTQSIFATPLYVNYGKLIAQHDYANPGFKLSLGFKDADLVMAAARKAHVPMPLASMMHDRFLSALAKDRGELDWTAAALNVSEDAGLRS
ncbi:6-phosphogluconate dehydrogenase [Massilia sp. Root133]|uniref:NAD(P)-dependent oxidoreductase n=1 Tax=unclassified Massilia TaxID=2609279 RepID=UPI0006FC34FC|nr:MULTISPECIES: NAD(P)-dependent oxidoreductase [unclassified Massilia]KQY14819.1 6-phosphogluconate dehydrogenase [Massilia sp. Root133]KQZ43638.1 6-phosphogluconate dehydrogenase [Massilia sp. Root1485]